jgi:hypothetical protein
MSRLDQLLENYRDVLRLPWRAELSGAERVWFAVYPPELERKLLARLDAFRLATEQGEIPRTWTHLSLEDRFGAWMAAQEYRQTYFRRPERAAGLPAVFAEELAGELAAEIRSAAPGERSVVALSGVATLFGIARLSALVKRIEDEVPGNLLVFFPGEYQNNQFRLLDARDGWNYHALPITCVKGTHDL